ncbi:MAG: sensor histidine kinase [Ramlibacter sp.]
MNTTHPGPSRTQPPGSLATYLQQMRDQERGDLARELHDELGSLLTGAKLEVASLKLRLDGASDDVLARLKHLGETINSGISFSRRVVEGLHPSSLKNLGLRASLEILAREFGLRTGIATATELEDADLDEATQLTVYRVAQESLNNTSKYAKATEARIVMLNCGPEVMVTVRDNGAGFEPAAVGTSSHGLAGMRHRVGACGGQLTVSSATGRGTLLVAVLPKRPVIAAADVAPGQPETVDTFVVQLERLLAVRQDAMKRPVLVAPVLEERFAAQARAAAAAARAAPRGSPRAADAGCGGTRRPHGDQRHPGSASRYHRT